MSKTNFKNKPLGWYFHRALCWFGWQIRSIDNYNMYTFHLRKMVRKYKYSYYGDKW